MAFTVPSFPLSDNYCIGYLHLLEEISLYLLRLKEKNVKCIECRKRILYLGRHFFFHKNSGKSDIFISETIKFTTLSEHRK